MIEFDKLKQRTGRVVPKALGEQDGLYRFDRGFWGDGVLYESPESVIRKFSKCFCKAWEQIPVVERERLKRFWNPPRFNRFRQDEDEDSHPSPQIVLSDALVRGSKRNFAAFCRGGHELIFDIPYVEGSTQTDIVHVVAHELGHAVTHVDEWFDQHECDSSAEADCVACECRAFSYMAAWGFDPFHDLLPTGTSFYERFAARMANGQ